jgi:hypothetical protein
MTNKISFFLIIAFIFSCTNGNKRLQKPIKNLTSWDIIDGIISNQLTKQQIELSLGKPKKQLSDGANIYMNQDSQLQTFAIMYKKDGQTNNFSFIPQEKDLDEFSYDGIKSRWKKLNCVDSKEQIVHPDFIENKYWFECTNKAKVYYSNKKEIQYIVFEN